MDPVQAPGVYEGAANVIAAVMLLLEFGMLRQALARDQVRLYMAQSALISVLAIVIAADRNLPDLYALAALSAALKVVAVPLVLRRLRNPGITNLDFALQKRIPIREGKYLEFRTEAFNLSNTPLFTAVGNSLGGSSFGKITAAQAERQVQFGLKLYF